MNRRLREKGGAIVELALLSPWIFFIFAGSLDFGFYAYALVSVEGAARTAAMYASTNSTTAADSTSACTYVLNELKNLPNLSSTTTCAALPLRVTSALTTGADGTTAARVSVTYQSLPLIPIPGLFQNQFTWTRSVKMRVRT